MKIVSCSNFDLDYFDEKLICENILNEEYAVILLKGLLLTVRDNDADYYKIVKDDYVLKTADPN